MRNEAKLGSKWMSREWYSCNSEAKIILDVI